MITIRPAEWPQDIAYLSILDTEVVTERILRPIRDNYSFQLVEEEVNPPRRNIYPFDPADPAERKSWDYAAIAEEGGKLAGFAAAQYQAWNRRVVLWHLYVMSNFQRQGVGTRLLTAVDAYAHSVDARCVWLETQNTNYPAIQFYRHAGFEFCGFDESLYDPASLKSDETALFFNRFI